MGKICQKYILDDYIVLAVIPFTGAWEPRCETSEIGDMLSAIEAESWTLEPCNIEIYDLRNHN